MACLSDEQLFALDQEVPRAVQTRLQRRPSLFPVAALSTGAGDGRHLLRFEIQSPNGVVLAVGDVQRLAFQRQPLRVVEARLVKRTIHQARLAHSGDGLFVACQVGDDDTMVRAVGDEEALAWGVGEDLAGEEKRSVARFLGPSQVELSRLLVQRLFFLVDLDEFGNARVQGLIQALPRAHGEHLALGVDQDESRPGAELVGIRDLAIGVVDDGMAYLVAQYGFADAGGVALVGKLGAMDANHDQFVGVLLLQLRQVGQGVDAIDAAQSPEIEDHDLAAQVLHANGAGRVQPGDASVQLGGQDGLGVGRIGGGDRGGLELAGLQGRVVRPLTSSQPPPVPASRNATRSSQSQVRRHGRPVEEGG